MSRTKVVSARSAKPSLRSRIPRAISHRLARGRKYLWQRRHLQSEEPTRAFFLVGCQRSGTNMFDRVVDRSPRTWVYDEDNRVAFRDYRLLPEARVERLIERCPAPIVLFKPLTDSQWIDRILDRHPGSRAIWMYRRYPDVANSAVRMWGSHQRDSIRRICEARWDELGWQGERLSRETRERIEAVYREDLTDHEGAVLRWYLRNRFFFELDLERDERVLMVKYEEAVTRPEELFARIFEFLECPFEPAYVEGVRVTSIGKEALPGIRSEIRAVAEEMLGQLDAAYLASRLGSSGGERAELSS